MIGISLFSFVVFVQVACAGPGAGLMAPQTVHTVTSARVETMPITRAGSFSGHFTNSPWKTLSGNPGPPRP